MDDDILSQLRDIHLPAELDTAPATAFAPWPFVVLAFAVAAILLVRAWNRGRWRRDARAELAHILSNSDRASQWAMLLAFAGGLSLRSGRSLSLPDAAFGRPEAVTDEQRSELIALLSMELRR